MSKKYIILGHNKRIGLILAGMIAISLFNCISFVQNSNQQGSTLNDNEDLKVIKQEPISASITGSTPPASGTWTVNANTIIENEYLVINGTIYVNPGISLEIKHSQILFNNTGGTLYLQGNNATISIINSNITSVNLSDPLLRVYVNNNSLLKINGSKLYHFLDTSAYDSNIDIYNSSFTHFDLGLACYYSTNVSISHSNFADGRMAIYVDEGGEAQVFNNTIQDIWEENILIMNRQRSTLIENNTIRGNGTDYNCVGIRALSSAFLIIKNNSFSDHHKSFFWSDVNHTLIGGNSFVQKHQEDGELQFVGGTNVTLEFNHLYNLTYDGIEIYQGENYVIRHNTIEKIGAGCHIDQNPTINITIQNNTFIEASIIASSVEGLYILGNNFDNGTINVANSSTIEICDNIICGPKISLSNCTGVIQEGNTYPCEDLYSDGKDRGKDIASFSILGLLLSACVVIGIVQQKKSR